MTRRTRHFLIGSVAFLVIGLTAGLLSYFGGIPGAVAEAGVDELRYVPSDAVVVAYADVDNLMNSQFRQVVKDIEPGDVIVVPEEFGRIAWLREIRDITQIIMDTAVVAAVILKLY